MKILSPLIILCLFRVAKFERILLILPALSYSHNRWFVPVVEELLLRNHKITAITAFPLTTTINNTTLTSNIREIDISEACNTLKNEMVSSILATAFQTARYGSRTNFWRMKPVITNTADVILSKPEISELINNPNEKFNLVILDWFGFTPFLAFAEHFKCPLIGIFSQQIMIINYGLIGNPLELGYRTDYNLLYHYPMTIWERMINVIVTAMNFRYFYQSVPLADTVVAKHFNGMTTSTLEMEKRVSGLVLNTNPILDGVRPLNPTIIEVGSLSTLTHVHKALPQAIADFINSADKGVIYISFGSEVPYHPYLASNIVLPILKICFKLNYKVLLKWDPKLIPGNSSLRVSDWWPQKDILCHPKMKLFITHGGHQSMEESIAAAVPLIVFPIFADQYQNGNHIKHLGVGEVLGILSLTESTLNNTIYEMVETDKYKQQVKKVSKAFMASIPNPLEKAVHFIEYVMLIDGGDALLRSPAIDLSFISYYLIDVVFFILFILLLFSTLSYYLVRLSYNKMRHYYILITINMLIKKKKV